MNKNSNFQFKKISRELNEFLLVLIGCCILANVVCFALAFFPGVSGVIFEDIRLVKVLSAFGFILSVSLFVTCKMNAKNELKKSEVRIDLKGIQNISNAKSEQNKDTEK